MFNESFLVLLFYQPGCTVMYGSSFKINAFTHQQTVCGAAQCASSEQCSFATRSEELRVKIIMCDNYMQIFEAKN